MKNTINCKVLFIMEYVHSRLKKLEVESLRRENEEKKKIEEQAWKLIWRRQTKGKPNFIFLFFTKLQLGEAFENFKHFQTSPTSFRKF